MTLEEMELIRQHSDYQTGLIPLLFQHLESEVTQKDSSETIGMFTTDASLVGLEKVDAEAAIKTDTLSIEVRAGPTQASVGNVRLVSPRYP